MHDPLDLRATPQRVWRLFREGIFPPEAWETAQTHSGQRPTQGEWLGYVDRLLLILGTVFLVAGVLFFFAFNWADLPKFGKFAVVQGAVVGVATLAFVLRLERWGGRVALAAAFMLVGIALAVIGQTYQTGADSYQLFVNWLLLITGWVIISRWNVLWLMWMVLANVALSMYWWQVVGGQEVMLNLLIVALNYSFIIIWEFVAWRSPFEWMRHGRWHLGLFMLLVLGHVTYFMLDLIFGFSYRFVRLDNYTPLAYALVIAGNLIIYMGGIRRDLGMVALTALSVLIVSVMAIARGIYELYGSNFDVLDGYGYTFIMGVITLGFTTLMVYGLRALQRRWEVDA